jgi:HD-GYP domain-containing protein (c-di-GMP phosphodiesterase class II)
MLHDVGKKRVRYEVINKPGPLDDDEWQEILKHPEWGVEILEQTGELTPEIRGIVLSHHENHDGTGYPHGISGSEIPPLTKIVTIADIYDAVTSKRSYAEPLKPSEALHLMKDKMANKFDPKIFGRFHKNLN